MRRPGRAIAGLVASIFALSGINGCALQPREHHPRLTPKDLRELLDPNYKAPPKDERVERVMPYYLEDFSTGEREYTTPNVARVVGELIKRYVRNNYEEDELPRVILTKADNFGEWLSSWTKLNFWGLNVRSYASNNQVGLNVSDED